MQSPSTAILRALKRATIARKAARSKDGPDIDAARYTAACEGSKKNRCCPDDGRAWRLRSRPPRDPAAAPVRSLARSGVRGAPGPPGPRAGACRSLQRTRAQVARVPGRRAGRVLLGLRDPDPRGIVRDAPAGCGRARPPHVHRLATDRDGLGSRPRARPPVPRAVPDRMGSEPRGGRLRGPPRLRARPLLLAHGATATRIGTSGRLAAGGRGRDLRRHRARPRALERGITPPPRP